MTQRKGIFSFLRGMSPKSEELAAEDQAQRDYALSQEKQESGDVVPHPVAPEDKAGDIDNLQLPEEEVAPGEPLSEEVVNYCEDMLQSILNKSGFEPTLKVLRKDDSGLVIDIEEEVDLGRIIGKDGATLGALQTLLRSCVLKKFDQPVKVILDAGDYRQRRNQTIRSQAVKAAKNVIRSGRKVKLKPMNAAERRLVHVMFKHHDKVRSFSVGDGPNRQVILERRANGSDD